MKIFQYAILYNPNADEQKNGDRATLVVEPTTVLAEDQQQATLLAARAIPQQYLDKLARLEVAVRPF